MDKKEQECTIDCCSCHWNLAVQDHARGEGMKKFSVEQTWERERERERWWEGNDVRRRGNNFVRKFDLKFDA